MHRKLQKIAIELRTKGQIQIAVHGARLPEEPKLQSRRQHIKFHRRVSARP